MFSFSFCCGSHSLPRLLYIPLAPPDQVVSYSHVQPRKAEANLLLRLFLAKFIFVTAVQNLSICMPQLHTSLLNKNDDNFCVIW